MEGVKFHSKGFFKKWHKISQKLKSRTLEEYCGRRVIILADVTGQAMGKVL